MLDSLACARASRIFGESEGPGQSQVLPTHRKVRCILIGDGGYRGDVYLPHSELSFLTFQTPSDIHWEVPLLPRYRPAGDCPARKGLET